MQINLLGQKVNSRCALILSLTEKVWFKEVSVASKRNLEAFTTADFTQGYLYEFAFY